MFKAEIIQEEIKCMDDSPIVPTMVGILRKKGLFFLNERVVKLNSKGEILYYDLDKPTVVKEKINLRHLNIAPRFIYAGRRP
jgi:folate-dependent tRNA-U54 methylase TrmFO/GidA